MMPASWAVPGLMRGWLKNLATFLGLSSAAGGLELLDAAMAELDKDGDGSIVYEEFVSWYLANDEQSEQAETTVAGLGDLVDRFCVTDETYMWVDGLGEDWISYGDAKQFLPRPSEIRAAQKASEDALAAEEKAAEIQAKADAAVALAHEEAERLKQEMATAAELSEAQILEEREARRVAAETAEAERVAVSYTHLTLPTMCSV